MGVVGGRWNCVFCVFFFLLLAIFQSSSSDDSGKGEGCFVVVPPS